MLILRIVEIPQKEEKCLRGGFQMCSLDRQNKNSPQRRRDPLLPAHLPIPSQHNELSDSARRKSDQIIALML